MLRDPQPNRTSENGIPKRRSTVAITDLNRAATIGTPTQPPAKYGAL